jgi:Na+/H+-dicarboxylate symporter
LEIVLKGLIILPAIYFAITRKNVITFAKNMSEALLIAVATSSSTAALPITFDCVEKKNKIHRLISRFVLPVGATS